MAVIIVHHTRKGAVTPGDPDSARGASAIIGAGRIVATLVGMSEDDAAALGIPPDRKTRSRYVRLDGAKSNYAGIGEPAWYEKSLFVLDNGETVPAAVPWTAPDMWESISPAVANLILDDIDAGIDGGKRRFSIAANATALGAWRPVLRHAPSITETPARKVIATWRKNGVLYSEEYDDPIVRKPLQGAFVNNAKRPGSNVR